MIYSDDWGLAKALSSTSDFTLEGWINVQQIPDNNGATLAAFRGRDVRFRFALENGTRYSFWVSRGAKGCSNGYLAGGGPDYAGLVDR